MSTGKYRIEGSEVKIESEMLDLPYTMPDDADGFQMLSVVEDINRREYKIHVNFADVMDDPENWGMYLADVARVLARDYRGHFGTTEADAFAAIRKEFFRGCAENSEAA
jgi:hypothetical protein